MAETRGGKGVTRTQALHWAVRIPLQKAEAAKAFLAKKGLLVPDTKAVRDETYVYFPVMKKEKTPFDAGFVRKRFETIIRAKPFRKVLEKTLGKPKADAAAASFDTLGDIAIIEVPDAVKAQAKKMAEALLRENPKIKTVLAKASAMKGQYRVRALVWLAGKKTYTCQYRESGCVMRFDVRKTYFSTRLSFERHRIAGLVKPTERVLALFAGVGPFALVIAKARPSANVVAVELNPYAAKAMEENVCLNRLANVTAIKGDVRDVVKKYPQWADRVTMPLPHTGQDFLPDAIFATADGGAIHFYGFGDENEGVYKKAEAAVKKACQAAGVKHKILNRRIVRPFAPRVFQIVLDVKILRN